jgi:TolA-binding protein
MSMLQKIAALRKEDSTAFALLMAVALALAVVSGVSLSGAASGALQAVLRAAGVGQNSEIRAEQRQQATTIGKLEKTVNAMIGEIATLNARSESTASTGGMLALDERLAKIDAELGALKARFAGLRFADPRGVTEARIAAEPRIAETKSDGRAAAAPIDEAQRREIDKLNAGLARDGIEIDALRTTLDERDQSNRKEFNGIYKRLERLETLLVGHDLTGSTRPTQRSRAPNPLGGWKVTHAQDGYAVITGRGARYDVMPGYVIPTLGRIAEVRQRGSRWVVVTEKGVIAQR